MPPSLLISVPEQSVQVWQVLVSAAHLRQTLTYTLLADRIGLSIGALAQPITMVSRYCSLKQLPPLTVLVVQADAGTPATGYSVSTDIDFAREAVYQLEWFKLRPPAASDFALVESMGFGEPVA